MLAQGVASFVRFVRQLHIADFTDVAVHVEILLHCNDPHCLFSSFNRGDTLTARRTFGSEYPVEVIDTIDFVVKVHGEGNSVQAIVAYTTTEAAGMVSFPYGLKNALHYQVSADFALLRGLLETRVKIVLFAVDLSVDVVESLASECASAGATDKAGSVVQVSHSLQRNVK